MSWFRYEGILSASKSHFNRALICASHASDRVALQGHSLCEDVLLMQRALSQLGSAPSLSDCGSAGTVLRFLALRVSRVPGRHVLKGTPRLLSRPQEDLHKILDQLQVQLTQAPDHLVIEGEGWKPKAPIVKISREKSSQFASAVLLNSWGLDFPLQLQWNSEGVSEGYWQMTLQVVKDFGMVPILGEGQVQIPAHSRIQIQSYPIESDLSSAFAIAAYAVLNGEAVFRGFPFQSLQPDLLFLEILKEMGVGIRQENLNLHVLPKSPGRPQLQGGEWNLRSCPDLFPVLAILCGFAQGPSRLFGAPHLHFKESNRIQKTAELLWHMGVPTRILPDGMEINPPAKLTIPPQAFDFDPDQDHRLAFAAALLASQQYPIRILHPEVVNKSFPEFWQILINNTGKL